MFTYLRNVNVKLSKLDNENSSLQVASDGLGWENLKFKYIGDIGWRRYASILKHWSSLSTNFYLWNASWKNSRAI